MSKCEKLSMHSPLCSFSLLSFSLLSFSLLSFALLCSPMLSSSLLSSVLLMSCEFNPQTFSGHKKHFATNILQAFFICLCAWLGRGQTHSQCCIYIQPYTVSHKFIVFVDFACISISYVIYFEPYFLSNIFSHNPPLEENMQKLCRECTTAIRLTLCLLLLPFLGLFLSPAV